MAGKPKPVEPRFWGWVRKAGPDECWEWTGSKTVAGYGVMSVNGRLRMAHRISFWMATGEDMAGDYYVCHRCDNPGCVNPAHLWKGSNSDNIRDAVGKGRMFFQKAPELVLRGDAHPCRNNPTFSRKTRERQLGEGSHRAKLTEAQVRQVFELRAQKLTQQQIAEIVGITREGIGRILRRDSWPHLEGLPSIPKRRTCGKWLD